MKKRESEQYLRLLNILDTLRVECPWDRKQTFESLRSHTIEECFELCDSLSANDISGIKEELGDILLHIAFYSKIAEEQSLFDIEDVARTINEKLIYRHPHVFSTVKAKTAEDVAKNWETLKLKEKNKSHGVLSGVPRSLPALIKAFRIQQKAAGVGFDWDSKQDVWDKVKEEVEEVSAEIASGNRKNTEEEFGDLLFTIINAARHYGVDPEAALENTNKKFISRFNYIEENSDKPVTEMTLAEMDLLWNRAKKEIKNGTN